MTSNKCSRLKEARAAKRRDSLAPACRREGEQTRSLKQRLLAALRAASYDRALASEFSGIFDNVDVGSGTDDSGFEDLPFGRSNTWRISLALTQNLYSGGRLSAQASVANAGREAASLGVTTARGQLLVEVTQAYYDAALSDSLVRIAEATREQAGATLRQTQAGFDAGTQPEFEVIRARVTRDSQSHAGDSQRANREVLVLRLKQMMDLPQDFNLQLADALEDDDWRRHRRLRLVWRRSRCRCQSPIQLLRRWLRRRLPSRIGQWSTRPPQPSGCARPRCT